MKTMKFRLNWLKKREHPVPENATCRNCGAQMQGRYCHVCGQDIFAGTGIPILKLIGQVLDNAFALEGKTPRTLANLLFRPGFLSNEYMTGKVIRYVNPVKLFWMASLIFFAIIVVQNDRTGWQKEAIKNIKASDNININLPSEEKNVDIETKKQQIIEFIALAPQIFSKFAPYVAFLLIPFFAILLALFFWRKKYYYIHHLIFTIHFHTFIWIFYSLIIFLHVVANPKYPAWVSFMFFFIPGIYLILALHRFYHPQIHHFKLWWQTIWKSILVTILYFIIFCFITGFIAAILIKVYLPEFVA